MDLATVLQRRVFSLLVSLHLQSLNSPFDRTSFDQRPHEFFHSRHAYCANKWRVFLNLRVDKHNKRRYKIKLKNWTRACNCLAEGLIWARFDKQLANTIYGELFNHLRCGNWLRTITSDRNRIPINRRFLSELVDIIWYHCIDIDIEK